MVEATEATDYNADGALVSGRVSPPRKGPDISESIFVQTHCMREETMPFAQTVSLPSEQTHADDDSLVLSVNFPARFGRWAGLSKCTNIARNVKAHRQNDN